MCRWRARSTWPSVVGGKSDDEAFPAMVTDDAEPATRVAYAPDGRHGRPDDPDSRALAAVGATSTAASRGAFRDAVRCAAASA